jgi:hypothetical protein
LKEQDASTSFQVAKSGLKCDGCETSEPVVAFCDTCFEYLCDFCSVAHKRLKRFTEHNVKDVGDINLSEASKGAIASRQPLCRQHPNEVIATALL